MKDNGESGEIKEKVPRRTLKQIKLLNDPKEVILISSRNIVSDHLSSFPLSLFLSIHTKLSSSYFIKATTLFDESSGEKKNGKMKGGSNKEYDFCKP